MRRCIATVCLSGGLEEKIRAAAAAGFDAIELFETDLLCFDGSPREVRDLTADLGMTIDLYQPFRDFEGVGPDQFARNLERAERKFDLMQTLGAPMVLVCSNVSPDTLGEPERAAEQLRTLAERAAQRNLRVGYEALAWGARTRHVSEAWRLVSMADHPHLGIVLDSFHMLALGDDPAVIAGIPGDRIAFVQLADAPKLTLDVLSWSRRFRCFPGQGDFDLAGFVQPILQAGYTGPLSLEVFNDEFRSGSTRQTARDGHRSLQLLEEDIRRREEARPPTPDGGLLAEVDLADPPAAPRLDGVGFIEVAVDRATAAELAAWLAPFGFKTTGRHRSKNVTLHEAGDVHFILNAEPDSFAHAYYLSHGVSVCALGLRVDDAHRAMNRATDYRCQRFDGRVGPNELQIPAIRALDGSLIYFISEKQGTAGLYDIDFERTGTPEAGFSGVDHIALALPPGQLDSWALFYRAILGLRGAAPQAINDPYGVVRSRALTDDGRAVRFALNVSTFAHTEVAQSIAEMAGAGVQQIALACDDLVGMAEGFRARGAAILPIHENYYEDLASKSLLDRATVDRLQSLNILYDRSPAGEFLHAYSPTFEGRFFLEFVERIGGYDGYGEANAPFRLAAQGRLRKAEMIGKGP